MATLNFDQASLIPALTGATSTGPDSPVVMAPTSTSAKSLYPDENETKGPTNTPLAASGNALTSHSAIQQSNKTLAHACDTGSYVGLVAAQAGAVAGQVVYAIRQAIQAILKALGINPSSTGIASYLEKIAHQISDWAKLLKKITAGIQQVITYINAIKQLLAYILSLPGVLLKYFADCVKTLEKQLVAGYNSAFSETGSIPSADQITSLSSSINDIKTSINEFGTALAETTAATTALTVSLAVPTTINSGNTAAQAATTQSLFAAAGFTNTTGNYSKP